MENDLSTDAIGFSARPDIEDVDMSQEQTVPTQTQTLINPDQAGSGTPQELRTQSQSDTFSDISDSPLIDLSTADSANNICDPHPTGPETRLCESKDNNVIDQCLTEQVLGTQQFEENIKQGKHNISNELPNIDSSLSKKRYAQQNLTFPPVPPLEWRLNQLLDEIALDIDETELNRVKLLFTGPEGIGKAVLEKCNTCLKLFTVLKEIGYISRDNVLYLNKILYILGRKDLIERTVQYCHDEGDVIHYYSVQGEPDSGNRRFIIHVVADVSKFDQEVLDRLRYTVAGIVCAPPEVVIISAVEPGSSFLITLTMPDMYVDVLKHLLEKKAKLWRLVVLKIDTIIIDDVRYAVSGQCTDMKVTEQYIDVMNVYEQLEDARKKLEQMETVTLQCHEELNNARIQIDKTEAKVKTVDSLEKTNKELATTCTMLQSMHLTSEVSESALESFRLIMKEAIDKGQDVDLLNRILKCNTEIVDGYHRVCNAIELEKQSTKLKEKKMNEKWLRQQLAANLKSANEVLMLKYSRHTLDIVLNFNTNSTSALNEVTEELTSDEMSVLLNRYTLDDEDVIKACIDADKRLLLLGLECKLAEKTQKRVNTNQFLRDLGREINRDLYEMYSQRVTRKNEENEKEKKREQNLELLKQLQSKLKCPEEILLCYCNQFVGILDADGRPVAKELLVAVVKPTVIKCKGLCHFLKEGEISDLKRFTSPEDDVIQACIKEDGRLLVPGLMLKQIEISKRFISPEKFVANLQNELKRRDLLNLFMCLKIDETEQQKQIENWHDKKSAESELLQNLTQEQNSAEEVLQKKFHRFTLKLVGNVETMPVFDKLTKLISGLSAKLNEDETKQLIGQYHWSENDVIKACINADKRLLLLGLFCKETEMIQKVPPFEHFVSTLLCKAKRMDLDEEFRGKVKLTLIDVNTFQYIMDMVYDYTFNSGRVQDFTKQLLQEAGTSSVPCFTGLRYNTQGSELKYKTTETTLEHIFKPIDLD